MSRWSGPGYTLVGDAAHAVTSNLGQGACMAIEDAVALGGLMNQHWNEVDGMLQACYEYEFGRKTHVNNVTKQAVLQNRIAQWKSPLAMKCRETLLYLIPGKVFVKKLKATNLYDVESDVKRLFLAHSKKNQ